MYAYRIEQTCSMLELGNVTEGHLNSIESIKYYLKRIDLEKTETECRVLIYNTTLGVSLRNRLKKFGFKEVFSYPGNSKINGRYKIVYTMMAKTSDVKKFLK